MEVPVNPTHVNVNKCKYLIIHSPQGFSGIIYNTGWGTFARLLKVQFTSTEGMSDDAPIHECESEIDRFRLVVVDTAC